MDTLCFDCLHFSFGGWSLHVLGPFLYLHVYLFLNNLQAFFIMLGILILFTYIAHVVSLSFKLVYVHLTYKSLQFIYIKGIHLF